MEQKKEPVDAIKSLIDVIQAAFTAAWKAVLLLGGLILVAYCYFESIVPEGLSLGDAFFLASAAFSFTCIALVGVGFGVFSTLWALKLLVVANNFRLKRRGSRRRLRCIAQSITDRWFYVVSRGAPFGLSAGLR